MNKFFFFFAILFTFTEISAQNPCSITASVMNVLCHDNNTPVDPSDDTYDFEVSVSGSNTGLSWTANDPNSTTDLYANNPTFFGAYPISDGDLTITITDAEDNTCIAIINVTAPGTCSNHCQATVNPHYDFLTATSVGIPPFSYLWSNGSTIDTADITGPEMCVTITDANGCVSTDCVDLSTACDVTISKNNGLGALEALVTSPTSDINYMWSSGATTINIYPSSIGTYTVTATNTVTTCAATEKIELSCGNEISKIDVQIDSSGTINTLLKTTNFNHFGSTTVLWNTGDTTHILLRLLARLIPSQQ